MLILHKLTATTVKATAAIRILCAGIILNQLLVTFASAAEYSVDNDVRLSSLFDDNARLSVGFKDELYGGVLENRFNISKATETSNLTAGLDLISNHYNINAFSTFDQRLNLGYSSSSEIGSWNLNLFVNRDSTRNTDVTPQGIGSFDLFDTRVTSNQLSFGWNRNLNSRNVLVWNNALNTVQYENAGRADYKFGSSSLLWQYIFSERLRFQTIASYSLLDSNEISSCNFRDVTGQCLDRRELDNEQSTIRLQLGLYYLINEHWTLDLLVGDSTVDTDSTTKLFDFLDSDGNILSSNVSGTNSGVTYNLDLSYAAETMNISFLAEASNTANSNGILVLTTSLAADMNWRLTPRHVVKAEITWFEQETSSGANRFFNDRELSTMVLRYQYRINPEWDIGFRYRIDDQRRISLERHAYSNEFALTLFWRPTTLKWSR